MKNATLQGNNIFQPLCITSISTILLSVYIWGMPFTRVSTLLKVYCICQALYISYSLSIHGLLCYLRQTGRVIKWANLLIAKLSYGKCASKCHLLIDCYRIRKPSMDNGLFGNYNYELYVAIITNNNDTIAWHFELHIHMSCHYIMRKWNKNGNTNFQCCAIILALAKPFNSN